MIPISFSFTRSSYPLADRLAACTRQINLEIELAYCHYTIRVYKYCIKATSCMSTSIQQKISLVYIPQACFYTPVAFCKYKKIAVYTNGHSTYFTYYHHIILCRVEEHYTNVYIFKNFRMPFLEQIHNTKACIIVVCQVWLNCYTHLSWSMMIFWDTPFGFLFSFLHLWFNILLPSTRVYRNNE